MRELHLKIWGDVQGVNFRRETLKKASSLGLYGWAQNRGDSSVEILAQGDEKKLEELFRWAEKGPPYARIENIEVEWQDGKKNFNDFVIRY